MQEYHPDRSGRTVQQCSDGYASPSPVGSFAANGFGLYDVLGNAWQWLGDCWNESHRGRPTDESAGLSGDCSKRVRRGGSWDGGIDGRFGNHDWAVIEVRSSALGFRVAMTLPPLDSLSLTPAPRCRSGSRGGPAA